jgi:glucan endo-1,3-alpha-glucosidase
MRWGACAWLLTVGSLCGCARVEAQKQRLVFAHYMVTNQDYAGDNGHNEEAKIAAYEREIKQAQALGIDGFALNVGGWLQQTYYIRYTSEMFEAAVRLHSGFKLMFSADMCCGNGVEDVEDMMRRFAGNPRYAGVYFQQDGRFVLTTFAGDRLGTAGWTRIRTDLERGTHASTAVEAMAMPEAAGAPSNAPLRVFFVPAFFWGGELPSAAPIEDGLQQWKQVVDGSFYWGIAGVPGSGGAMDQVRSSEAYARVVHKAGKLYMAPVALQFWGANANRYYEYSGTRGMGLMWKDAIETSHPEWVEIITWNDFIEGTYVSPIDDPNRYPTANFLSGTGVPSGTLGYFHSHAGVDALLAFYIRWYKTGVQPAITQDALTVTYRTQSMHDDAGVPPVTRTYGPVQDVVYVTARLTAPATLVVTSGARRTTLQMPAGLSDVSAPFETGSTPEVRLERNGRGVLCGKGADAIEKSPRWNDYYDSTLALDAKDGCAAPR